MKSPRRAVYYNQGVDQQRRIRKSEGIASGIFAEAADKVH